MTFHRRMIVVGLLVASSGSALASAGSGYAGDLGELQRKGQEGRGTASESSINPAFAEESSGSVGLGELQQRGEEGRGEGRFSPRVEDAVAPHLDLGEVQRRAQEGRGEPNLASGTSRDVASRD